MTGFANAAGECGGKRINLDIRAVNHRYLDVQFKMPDDLRHLEGSLREIIAASAVRGKIECRIQIQALENGAAELHVNQDLAAKLAALNEKWRKQFDGLGKLTVADILRFPGVLVSQAEDQETFALAVQNLLSDAVKDFSAAPENAAIVEAIKAKKQDPNGPFVMPSYAAVQVIAEAAKRSGSDDPETIAKTLREGEYDTAIGKIGFAKNGDLKDFHSVIYELHADGKKILKSE